MYRVLILVFLAIASFTFAIDSSDTILQAKSIGDTSVVLQWNSMEGATGYKVYYDESTLLNSHSAKPLFDSELTQKTEINIHELTPATEYTFIVHGFRDNKDIGTSLPVHVTTFHTVNFTTVGDPIATDAKEIQLMFTKPINIKKTQIVLTNTKTKKQVAIDHLETPGDDLRVVSLMLKKKLDENMTYEMMLKKVYTLAGTELAPENKTTLKIVYNPNAPTQVGPPVVVPSVTPTDTNTSSDIKTFDKPVAIDKLPQTGPGEIIVLLLIAACGAFYLQKKLHKGA